MNTYVSGERRDKDDKIFDALGACDELNASLGLAREFCDEINQPEMCSLLEEIMSRLFDVGSQVATPRSSSESSVSKLRHTAFDESHVVAMEKQIDAFDAQLPPLKNFILPSGGRASAQLHVSRTLARRAERRVWPLIREGNVDEVCVCAWGWRMREWGD